MSRLLVILLVLVYALVPPGFCTCRLQDLIFADASSGPEDHDHDEPAPGCPEDHDEHDCDCTRIQQDCLTSSGTDWDAAVTSSGILDPETIPQILGLPLNQKTLTPAHFWPGDLPLYLTLRALLL